VKLALKIAKKISARPSARSPVAKAWMMEAGQGPEFSFSFLLVGKRIIPAVFFDANPAVQDFTILC
jgi:hypothetical protein